MAEAEVSSTSFSNICPFCNEKMHSQFLLGKHLVAVHNICVNTNLKRNADEDWEKERMYFNATVDCNSLMLGNKMKTLKSVLKENFCKYIEKLKDWINCKISRTEFEEIVRSLFCNDTIVIHHEFLICFLKEIRSINRSSINIIRKKSNFAFDVVLLPVEEQPAEAELPISQLNKLITDNVKNTAITKTLPDEETLYALTLVHAWENECTSVNKKVVPVLKGTVETMLNIIRDVILRRRRSLKVKPDGSVYDATEVDPKDVSTDDQPRYTGSISSAEIIDALKEEKGLIPMKFFSKVALEKMNSETNKESQKKQDMEL